MKRLICYMLLFPLCLLCGCSKKKNAGPSMDDARSVEIIIAQFKQHIDIDGYKPILVWWAEGKTVGNILGALYGYIVDKDGIVYNRAVKLSGKDRGPKTINENQAQPVQPYNYDSIFALNADDIDPKLILDHIEAAKDEIPEEFEFGSVQQYMISLDPITGEKEYRFCINVLVKENEELDIYNEVDGVRIRGYIPMEFIGFADGSVDFPE